MTGNMNKNHMGKRYMPGLDGLRALSVLAVIAYHLDIKWAQGGLLGVGIFFVISGYLITDHIVSEWNKYQRLQLINFWIRRVRRLVPAMACMLLFVALWLVFVDPARLQALKGAYISSLFYVNNWWLIYHKVSYFESFGPASPIGHLWSLAIEEQFYLIWPLVLMIGLKTVPRRSKLTLWILACAAVSAFAMALIYEPGTDPSRVYYGTDTRAFALLIGAALAIVWPSQKLSERVPKIARRTLDITGWLGLFILIILIVYTNKFDDSLYRGGFVLLTCITAIVIAVLVHPASRVGSIMGWKPLRWIGVRSYSLYIWHFPVIILSSPAVNMEGPSVLRILLQIAASFILAALSYKYVEEPFRRGGFSTKLQIRSGRRYSTRLRYNRIFFLASLLIVFLIAFRSYFTNSEGKTSVTEEALHYMKQEKEDISSWDEDTRSGKGITVIGDSVILGVASYLENILPGIVIDGKVGRQMTHAQEVIDELKAQGKLGDQIIIELGTNGPFNKEKLRNLLHSLSDVEQIFLVNTRVPKEWQDTVNKSIKEVAEDFSNTTVVDWYTASEGKDNYFTQDGVHLQPKGAKYYASIIAEAVKGTS
ncbi:acyltransferase family protein [Lysinibacillus parviboronicapiens]|uniref:acyltransferase family protein n=1 Tax=Lysinibacillus parviboronicapiens TaxID=436516 RepID=UPI003F695675